MPKIAAFDCRDQTVAQLPIDKETVNALWHEGAIGYYGPPEDECYYVIEAMTSEQVSRLLSGICSASEKFH